MGDENKSGNYMLKTMLVGALMLGSAYVGDKIEPFSKLNERSFYRNASIEDGYYANPTNLDIVVKRNDKNRVEVYLVDTELGDSLGVSENMHVGSPGTSIDGFIDEKKNGLKEWYKEQKEDTTSLIYKIGSKF